MKAFIENNPPVNFFEYLSGLLRSGDNFKDILLTSRGRDAIQLAVDYLQIKESNSILLPALTCDTVSGVISSNCRTIFYDLNNDYSIDTSVLERFLKKNLSIKAIYVIHYFGFIHKNMANISSLCKKYGVALIEDHAHSALSDYDRNLADIQIFSFRKLFPTADGGGIRIAHRKMSSKFDFKSKLISNQKGLLIAFKRFASLYSSGMRSSIGKLIQHDINRLNIGNIKIEPLPISSFGEGIIRSSDLETISAIRRQQYLMWMKLLNTTHFNLLFPDLHNDTVPFGVPIKVENPREILDHFKKFNVFLKVHWLALPAGTKDSCPISHLLAQTSITLPIYPGLKEEHMFFIKDELLKYGIPFETSNFLQ